MIHSRERMVPKLSPRLANASRARGSRLRLAWPVLVSIAVACAWLNQGPSLTRYERMAASPVAASWQGIVERVRLPFAFLYRRAADEELYFHTARAILGRPFDRDLLERIHQGAADDFSRAPPADGRWHLPYAEVPLEYPAFVLPFMIVPAMCATDFDGFARLFGLLMAACLLGAAALCIHADASAPSESRSARWWLVSLLLLAQGGLAIQRLDAVVALLLALSLWGAARKRPGLAGAALGLAAGAKFLPVLLVGPLLAADRTAPGARRRALWILAGAVGGLALSLGPMMLAAPEALSSVLRYHAARGLQVESTLGLAYALGHLATGHSAVAQHSFGSFNFAGPFADRLAALSAPLMLVGVALVTLRFAAPANTTGASRTHRLAAALLAGCLALWLTGKVFSPQYMTWGLPLVVAFSDVWARRLGAWLLVAMALTQLYQRGFYDALTDGQPWAVLTLLARQVCLAVLGVLVIRAFTPTRRRADGVSG